MVKELLNIDLETVENGLHQSIWDVLVLIFVHTPHNQCCGAGAGGAEIILGPGAGAGAENKF